MGFNTLRPEEDLTNSRRKFALPLAFLIPHFRKHHYLTNSLVGEEVAISQIFPLDRRKCKHSHKTKKDNYCFCSTALWTVETG
jgi:hypothetical protein